MNLIRRTNLYHQKLDTTKIIKSTPFCTYCNLKTYYYINSSRFNYGFNIFHFFLPT
eukprot:UN00804